MTKQSLYDLFKGHFKEQLGLNLEEMLVIVNDKFVLKDNLSAISSPTMKLELCMLNHIRVAKFLALIIEDNSNRFVIAVD